ncbi:hypothetical protein QR680_005906 [Steinernema hermaphroditum]|uniref:Uncharacterized protein n=1 Tax=Steinernema hermaphroditum TaxID=289476 RepID=A0AA39LVP5_9BILA|nr:hypothetical protein QR680_005906 [Steinernema hermaphroditum]
MDEKKLIARAVQEGQNALRDGFFADTDALLKTVEKMCAVGEEISKLKAATTQTSRLHLSTEKDPWTPPVSDETTVPHYVNKKANFYGASDVIATYTKASTALVAALKTLESVQLMPGLLNAETKNGVRHLERTMKSMEIAERIIDDAVNSTHFDHTV